MAAPRARLHLSLFQPLAARVFSHPPPASFVARQLVMKRGGARLRVLLHGIDPRVCRPAGQRQRPFASCTVCKVLFSFCSNCSLALALSPMYVCGPFTPCRGKTESCCRRRHGGALQPLCSSCPSQIAGTFKSVWIFFKTSGEHK